LRHWEYNKEAYSRRQYAICVRPDASVLGGKCQRFPNHATMDYDLACAAAQCELWPEARYALYNAICNRQFLKSVAIDNPVFAPIKSDIEAMQPGN